MYVIHTRYYVIFLNAIHISNQMSIYKIYFVILLKLPIAVLLADINPDELKLKTVQTMPPLWIF